MTLYSGAIPPGRMPGKRVTREQVRIKLDGNGIRAGRADARVVASTLTAAADLVQAISSIEAFKGHEPPTLQVEASKEGSFELLLLLEAIGEWWATFRPALIGDDAQAVANLITYATVFGAVIEYLKKRGRRGVKGVVPREDGQVDVITDDDERITTMPEAAQAGEKRRVRRAAKNLADSANFLGVDTITIKVGDISVTMNGADADRFPDPAPNEPDLEATSYEAYATFRIPDFGGDVWTAETTRGPVRAKITDAEFLQRVNDGASMNKYAEYRITVHEEPRVTHGGNVVIDKTITKVLEAHERPRRALPNGSREGEA